LTLNLNPCNASDNNNSSNSNNGQGRAARRTTLRELEDRNGSGR
jgi:hypothetical protein